VLEQHPKDVRLVFKNYPLRNHKFAREAATAALAAERQGKFWEFHNRLFQHYQSLNNQKIQEIAKELGLNKQKFDQDMRDIQTVTRITRDESDAAKAGVRGTPTVFVNGRMVRSLSQTGIEALVAKELARVSASRP
jgi:protein-disulfide isomerase